MRASQLIFAAMPNLEEQLKSSVEERTTSSSHFIELLISDLVAARLITLHRLNETWTVPKFGGPMSSGISSVTTHLGNDFLGFITDEEARRE